MTPPGLKGRNDGSRIGFACVSNIAAAGRQAGGLSAAPWAARAPLLGRAISVQSGVRGGEAVRVVAIRVRPEWRFKGARALNQAARRRARRASEGGGLLFNGAGGPAARALPRRGSVHLCWSLWGEGVLGCHWGSVRVKAADHKASRA